MSRAHKKLSAIGSWENSKKAAVEAELKQIEVMRKQNICDVFTILVLEFRKVHSI